MIGLLISIQGLSGRFRACSGEMLKEDRLYGRAHSRFGILVNAVKTLKQVWQVVYCSRHAWGCAHP